MLGVPSTPLTSVVVVTWQGVEHVAQCLEALSGQTRAHHTIVVDNGSDDGTAQILDRHASQPRIIRLSRNTGYAGGLARALRVVETPYIAWLNDDARPATEWLAALEDTLHADDSAGAASARLEWPDGAVQSLGVCLRDDGHGADITSMAGLQDQEPSAPFGFCGAAALLRTDALRSIGGIPEEFFCYYEDTDTAWRLRLSGWRVRTAPAARARHLHGASSAPGSARFHLWNERNRLLMLLRCAPTTIALRELARFIAVTALLPLRRMRAAGAERIPDAYNFTVGVRSRALLGVLRRLPAALRMRRTDPATSARRRTIWQQWAGR